MSTADQARIEVDRAQPRIIQLWWALRPLKSVIRFMQTGAHPDDEISGMLAALAYRDGFNISYACSTRGEGGQNDVGQEAGAALGALRTREMERACDILGMRMYWHSETPDDPITDFGFSKSGEDTLARWGHTRTLARFVEIVRCERPDIICPTFLDVPGQHGHHRAITQAAHEVMTAAADPSFPCDHAPWQVSKMYLPAWSGAGQAYDDDLPPPPTTLTIVGSGQDDISGWAWDRIGQQSRAYHRTQGMGRWVPSDQRRDWPLHLVESHVSGPDDTLASGLAARLGDLANGSTDQTFIKTLSRTQDAMDATMGAFPAFDQVAHAAFDALEALHAARDTCPDALRANVVHRLDAKEVQLGHVIRLALGVDVRARVSEAFLSPGSGAALALETSPGDAQSLDIKFDLPTGWTIEDQRLDISEATAPTSPYRVTYDPREADIPAAVVTMAHDGKSAAVRVPFEASPIILPPCIAEVSPDAGVINLTTQKRGFKGRFEDLHPTEGTASVRPPPGWTVETTDNGFGIAAPQDVAPGLYPIPVHIDAQPAMTVQRIQHPHVAATALAKPSVLRLLALNAELPDVRVGYVGAGNDRVNHWLTLLGVDVVDISDAELSNAEDLAQYDCIILGIFTMRFRAALGAAMPQLHRWTQAGGTLVTLYHRPWDNWDPERTPPHRLEIGQPSLRWRVTDEAAPVRHLVDHPLLSAPNVIGPQDWNGWVKERGLYFAKSWDSAYTPLVEMADPDEAPHQGALLVADVGQGRHVHSSLILHHQMENLVPGAFRLMANFISKRT